MVTLKEDIEKQSDWLVKAFESEGYKLDYTIHSFIDIDKFFLKSLKNGKPKRSSTLSKDLKGITFSISCYLAETLVKNVCDSTLITDGDDPKGKSNFYVKLSDRTICFPVTIVKNRIKNGLRNGIYLYGYELTQEFTNEIFDPTYSDIEKEIKFKKEWWKFW